MLPCVTSPSSQRVWIEIMISAVKLLPLLVALFTEGVDWNLTVEIFRNLVKMSPSSQRVWIEICKRSWFFLSCFSVALFTEGVDWNSVIICRRNNRRVALFTEGVDWNLSAYFLTVFFERRPLHRGCGLKSWFTAIWNSVSLVALFTEGVDWNVVCVISCVIHQWRRPLHRGCGLKYYIIQYNTFRWNVALFTEGVDWNQKFVKFQCIAERSPSSQRVWIEMETVHEKESKELKSPSSQRVWIEILKYSDF